MKQKKMLRFYDESGCRVWETKDEDVEKLFNKNTPKPKFKDTLKMLKEKYK